MARYEHLPIYKAAFDLNLYLEQVVRNFSRYHKYTLGTELRNRARTVVRLIVRANNSRITTTNWRMERMKEFNGFYTSMNQKSVPFFNPL